jgi:hypothetical protein
MNSLADTRRSPGGPVAETALGVWPRADLKPLAGPTKQPCTRQFDRKQACAGTFLNVLENPNVGIPFIVQKRCEVSA